jgi:hypothetical protein
MNTADFDDAKLLWKMFYARESFRQARGAAEHIYSTKMGGDSPLFYPLIASVYVLYAKPFTRADAVGSLGDEMIPDEQKEFHRLIINHRHQIYAHRDGDGFEVADRGAVNQLRAIVNGGEIRLMATDFHARFPAMKPIIDLCELLEKKTDYFVSKLWHKHAKTLPHQNGEFLLNVTDSVGDMWVAAKPAILK